MPGNEPFDPFGVQGFIRDPLGSVAAFVGSLPSAIGNFLGDPAGSITAFGQAITPPSPSSSSNSGVRTADDTPFVGQGGANAGTDRTFVPQNVQSLLDQILPLFEAGFAEQNAARDRAVAGFTGLQKDIAASGAEREADIKNQRQFIQASFDPVLSKFDTLFNTQAISPELQQGLTNTIRRQSAIGTNAALRDLRSTLGGSGLSASSILGRESALSRQQGISDRLTAENQLQGTIAALNQARQLSAAEGQTKAVTALGGLDTQLTGLLTQSGLGTDSLLSSLQGNIAAADLGREFTDPSTDVLPAIFGLQQSTEDADFFKQLFEEANIPFTESIGRGIITELIPGFLNFLGLGTD